MQADRMRIQRADDALRLHAREHGLKNLVACASRANLLHRHVLHGVRIGEGALEAGRRVRFAGLQDVGEMLGVRVQSRTVMPTSSAAHRPAR
jgi:hypothetical protein